MSLYYCIKDHPLYVRGFSLRLCNEETEAQVRPNFRASREERGFHLLSHCQFLIQKVREGANIQVRGRQKGDERCKCLLCFPKKKKVRIVLESCMNPEEFKEK